MVTFTQVEQTLSSLLDDLRSAKTAYSNGFNIDKQLSTISEQYDMDLVDLKQINFED